MTESLTGPAPVPDSWALVESARDGNKDAFAELFLRYRGPVYHYVLPRLRYDRYLTEDFTQETFLRAYRKISTFSDRGRDIGAWFITIARNLIIGHVRSSRFKFERNISDLNDSAPYDTLVSSDKVEIEALKWFIVAAIRHAVDQLNPDHLRCIELRFYDGRSIAEAAAAMNRQEGAFKAMQHRAIKRLEQIVVTDPRLIG